MKMRIGLLVFIGIPGSGKTTLAKHLINNCSNYNGKSYNFIHVCYDELIHFPSGTSSFEWKSARDLVSVKVENIIKAIINKNIEMCPEEFVNQLKSWDSDFVLILDDNMYFKSMRYSLFQIAKKHKISFCQVYLHSSLQTALLRNSKRDPNSIIPPYIIENMYSKLEPPDCNNKWEKYSIQLNEFCDFHEVTNNLFSTLNDSLDNYFYEIDNDDMSELSKIQCKKSVLHQTDIALRKIISCRIKKFITENPGENSKNYISELNLRKSKIFSDIKVGNICLPEEVLEDLNSDDKFQLIQFLDSYL